MWIVGKVSNLLSVKLVAPLEKTDNRNSLELLFLVGIISYFGFKIIKQFCRISHNKIFKLYRKFNNFKFPFALQNRNY